MGQWYSKRSSAASTRPLTSISQYTIAPESSNGITKPDPPRRLHHLSELIDLNELFPSHSDPSPPMDQSHPGSGSSPPPSSLDSSYANPGSRPTPPARARTIIQSPSGQELDAYQYLNRADRPLTLQERQARIVERLEQESRTEGEKRREFLRVMQANEAIERKRRKKRSKCCGGWLCR